MKILDRCKQITDTESGRVLLYRDEVEEVLTAGDCIIGVLEQLPSAQPTLKGWVCPLCGRGLSPLTMVCPCQNGKGWKITCKTL